MKIYIAGRITGNPHYKAQFRAIEKMLQRERYTVLNPADLPEGMKPADYMRICFAMLDSADIAFFQSGWEESTGARLEFDYAKYIGKPIIAMKPDFPDVSDDTIRTVAEVAEWLRNSPVALR